MLIRRLQHLIATLYDAPVEHDVADFLITSGAQAASLQGRSGAPPTDEQLLIEEGDDGVAMSLYVDSSVLQRLRDCCPMQDLNERNLADYCTALEGVSHFHYCAWSAQCSREVSLLELELQAEVDKYASALRLMLAQREGRFPADLFHRLFEKTSFLPTLGDDDQRRYEEAHRFAARFCRRLEERFLRSRRVRPEAMLAQLRSFYRLGRHAKLRHAAEWS